MKRVIRKLLNSIGYDIVRLSEALDRNLNVDEQLGYYLEDEAADAIQVVRRHTMLSKRRLVTLYQQVEYCERNSLPGAFVECGVWKGGAVGLMALANLRFSATRRHLHLFDAFDDICEPDSAHDGERAVREANLISGQNDFSGQLRPLSGFYDHLGGHGTLKENQLLLEQTIGYDPAWIHYHAGWFQDTLPEAVTAIDRIALLRLDGDWYASTKVCLEYLFEKVVSGGIVILDDYGTYEGCRKAADEYLRNMKIYPYLSHVDSDCRYFIKT